MFPWHKSHWGGGGYRRRRRSCRVIWFSVKLPRGLVKLHFNAHIRRHNWEKRLNIFSTTAKIKFRAEGGVFMEAESGPLELLKWMVVITCGDVLLNNLVRLGTMNWWWRGEIIIIFINNISTCFRSVKYWKLNLRSISHFNINFTAIEFCGWLLCVLRDDVVTGGWCCEECRFVDELYLVTWFEFGRPVVGCGPGKYKWSTAEWWYVERRHDFIMSFLPLTHPLTHSLREIIIDPVFWLRINSIATCALEWHIGTDS